MKVRLGACRRNWTEDSTSFLRMGSAILIAAPLFLAAGIAAEIYVIMQTISAGENLAVASSVATLLALLLLWYAIPLALRLSLKNEFAGHAILGK